MYVKVFAIYKIVYREIYDAYFILFIAGYTSTYNLRLSLTIPILV